MKSSFYYTLVFFILMFLQSCEFNCSVGNKDEPRGKAVVQDGARVYNNIKLTNFKTNLEKAYLVFEDGSRVPDDNFVDFSQPVRLMLEFDGGWREENGKVMLGASEKIIAENGSVILDEPDLFQKYPDGINIRDANTIHLSANIKLRENAAPTSFSVQFRVWDKNDEGYIEGSYMLFSK